jgi:GR25 family glycosyltransferase involved in LPS biosynthesis
MPKFKAVIGTRGTLRLMGITLVLLIISLFVYCFIFSKSISKENFTDNNQWLDGVDIIYWINLDRSVDRKEWMEQLFQDIVFQGVPNQRISGIDGKNPNNIDNLLKNNRMEGVTDSEYGCFLSHLAAIRKFAESSNKTALFFEDDMTLDLKPYWKTNLKNIIENAPKDWEIIQLGYNSVDNTRKFLDDDYTKNPANGELKGAYAYLMNNSSAKRFIKSIDNSGKYDLDPKIHHSSDVYLYTVLNTHVYKYPMFIYKTDNDSTIHSGHLSGHELNKRAILEIYSNM